MAIGNGPINDEDFINRYSEKEDHESRSDKYVKGKDTGTLKGFGYMIFLIVVFLLAYYLFSTFVFPPQP
jgi:hypothetical protein